MRDVLLFGALVAAFAASVTLHVALVVRLARRAPRARGLLALLLPPLAAYWGLRARMRALSVGWVVCVVVYILARVLA